MAFCIDRDEPGQPPFKLRNAKCHSVSSLSINFQVTSKGSGQTEHMCRLAFGFWSHKTTLLEISCHSSYMILENTRLLTHHLPKTCLGFRLLRNLNKLYNPSWQSIQLKIMVNWYIRYSILANVYYLQMVIQIYCKTKANSLHLK